MCIDVGQWQRGPLVRGARITHLRLGMQGLGLHQLLGRLAGLTLFDLEAWPCFLAKTFPIIRGLALRPLNL